MTDHTDLIRRMAAELRDLLRSDIEGCAVMTGPIGASEPKPGTLEEGTAAAVVRRNLALIREAEAVTGPQDSPGAPAWLREIIDGRREL